MSVQYWLLKTEPETYSFEQLLKDGKTNWNGVRNYQARNNIRQMKVGDVALIYHSGDARAVVGVAKVVRGPYAEADSEGGDWTQVDVAPVKELNNAVSLQAIKSTSALSDMPLIKQSRLSVMPVTRQHYDTILKMSS